MADAFFNLLGMIHPEKEGGLRLIVGAVVSTEPLMVSCGGLSFAGKELRLNAGYSPRVGDSVLMLTEDDQMCHIICKEVGA